MPDEYAGLTRSARFVCRIVEWHALMADPYVVDEDERTSELGATIRSLITI